MNPNDYTNLFQHYLAQGLKKQDAMDASNPNNSDNNGPFDVNTLQKHFSTSEDKDFLENIGIFNESIDILTQNNSDSEDSDTDKKPHASSKTNGTQDNSNTGTLDTGFLTEASFHSDFRTGNNNPIPITPRAGTPRQKQLHLIAKKPFALREKLASNSSINANANTNISKNVNLLNTADHKHERNLSDTSNESGVETVPLTSNSAKTYKNNPKYPYNKLTLNSSMKDIDLAPELECLRNLILSQHEVFTPYLIDLANSNLTYSKQIQKKKENYELLRNNKKIPRSLRIKCDLTTSPNYASNTDFLQLKDNLKDIVKDFIQKGSKVMTEWAKINIQLLLYDRCHQILSIALKILDGLVSFHLDIMGMPNWRSVDPKYTTLYLFKVYLLHIFFNHEELLDFFELPQESILNIGAKIITKKDSEEEINGILNTLNIADIDDINAIEYEFMAETLTQFDSILKTTTIVLWSHNIALTKRATAVNNLKARMQTLDTINATQATAAALSRATEYMSEKDSQDEAKELRITNLERNFKKNEQKTNEIFNKLKTTNQKQKNTRKNATGNQSTESLVSPPSKTLSQHKYNKRLRMVDLTKEEDEESQYSMKTFTNSPSSPLPQHTTQRQKKIQRLHFLSPPQEKSIQWKQAEVLQYDPNYPVAHPALMPAPQLLTPMSLNTAINPPFFPPAPPPQPLMAPSPNPFYNHFGNQKTLPSQLATGQTQVPKTKANTFNHTNPFIQTDWNHHKHENTNKRNSRNTRRGRNMRRH